MRNVAERIEVHVCAKGSITKGDENGGGRRRKGNQEGKSIS